MATKITTLLLLALIGGWSTLAVADPPRHAPAHGWRKQHDPFYVGYSGKHWAHDFEILSGHCNREAVATVIGGMVGAVVGSRVAEPENRTVATIIGAAAGAIIGNRIGKNLDEADRSCVGHSLEVGKIGQQIVWTNESTGVDYEMTLGADREREGATCREFTLVAVADTNKSSRRSIACQSEPGVWQIEE